MTLRSIPLVLSGLAFLALPCPMVVAATPGEEEFEAKVRPLLVERCYKCHGPQKQSGGLRVDSREALLEGGENGPSIAPGDPDKSALIQAIRYAGDLQMPPKGKLDDPAVEALTTWVKGGAPWPVATAATTAPAGPEAWRNHWAFRPVQKPATPEVKDQAWVANPVDAFVLAALEAKGLHPSERADKRTLIRRATFDLTGLPPTEAEFAAFEADSSANAYATLVDRLLATPQYGERWGRHWLDVARYADSKGYVFVEDRRYPFAFAYRDWVIRAFNEDLPYNQFIIDQIAADRVVSDQDTRPLAAMGFLTVGRRFLNSKFDIIDDRIDVMSRGFLGLTVACARCHDHKFDPIPAEDYYSLFGIFDSSDEPADKPELRPIPMSPQFDDYQKQLKARRDEVDAHLTAKLAEIRGDVTANLAAFLATADDLGFNAGHGRVNELAQAAKLQPRRVRWFIACWAHAVEQAKAGHDPILAPWIALADLPAETFATRSAEIIKGWREAPDPAKPLNQRVVEALAESTLNSRKDVASRYAAAFSRAEAARRDPAPNALATDADLVALGQRLAAADGLLAQDLGGVRKILNQTEVNQLQGIEGKIAELDATHPGSPPRGMVLRDSAQPHDHPILLRGNPGRPGKVAPRRGPLAMANGAERKPFTDGSGRLELAREIARPDNPLTARVLVNRVWMHHFGVGLVGTASDFGTRSDPPSHPELLDDLASRFVEGGWSIKSLHRLIMLSSTYTQRGDDRPDCRAVDPTNRLLWKKARRRLEFEAVRDSVLAAAGRLDPTVGGRPFDLLQEPFTTRRTVYGLIDRQNLEGVYRAFDFASPDTTSPRRFSTIVPQQALFLMNSPFVAEQARHLAARGGTGTPDDTIRHLYGAAYGRAPRPEELALGSRFLEAQAAAPPPGPESGWITGFGSVDEASGRVVDFQPLPHWTGTTWQTGPTIPFGPAAFLNLDPNGGHPGPEARFAAIRRWVAPRDAVVAISGSLNHPGEAGDGVRARVVAGGSGVVGTWPAHHQAVATSVASVSLKAGETLDFVVDCLGGDNSDGFTWAPAVKITDGSPGRTSWDARADFLGPAPPGLTPLERYAQVLLLANEFTFVD